MDFDVDINVPGRFSVYNSLTAVAICRHFGVKEEVVKEALRHVSVKGRIEIIPISPRFTLMIDYAHNAMSLESLLTTLKEYEPKRLVCLFGCGGNRAKSRRYEMGEVSSKLADLTIVTSDNPRFEEPMDIIADIIEGVKKADGEYVMVADRKEAIEYAVSFSKCKEFIIEDFIEQNGFSSDTDSFSVDGELKFVSFNCQRFDPKAENPYTPAAYSWPSSMTAEHQSELKSEIQRLLSLLKMRTSIYNIETREGKDGKAYIMECSPRGGGNRLAECLRYATGVDMIENTVRAALGMKTEGIEQKKYNGCWAEVILHSDRAGIFERIDIADEIKECVIENDIWAERGDAVGGFSAANEAIGTVILKFETDEMLSKVMKNVGSYVKVVVK